MNAPLQGRMGAGGSRSMRETSSENVQMAGGGTRRVTIISAARAVHVDRQFGPEDNCPESSFQDYMDNKCWICCSERDEWDLWMSCRHLFCKECSTEMLHRQMPCPLCRVSSSTVLRGHKYSGGGAE